MDRVIIACFALCFLLAVIGGFMVNDFGCSIYGMMFWIIGWILQFSRGHYA